MDDERRIALFSHPIEFELGAVKSEDLPPPVLPEIAFAGRSNVGKSSLLNYLVNRKKLAHASNTPGRTKQLNFFNLDGQLRLVDLPGYGYAKAGKKEVKAWQGLTRQYLLGRPNLRLVLLLIDSRRGLLPIDEIVMASFDDAAVAYQPVLTKVDKLKKGELEKVEARLLAALKKHPAALPVVIATSSEKKIGAETIHETILRACGIELAA